MAKFAERRSEVYNVLAFALIISVQLLNSVTGQFLKKNTLMRAVDVDPVSDTLALPFARGDMVEPTPAPGNYDSKDQTLVFPSMSEDDPTRPTRPQDISSMTVTGVSNVMEFITTVKEDDVSCVDEAAVKYKDAVSLKLKAPSNCEESKAKIQSVLEHLCAGTHPCMLEIYQKDNSDELIISGQCIEEDAKGMAEKFNNDNIKDKVEVEEAVPHWGSHSKAVLISVLLLGLLLGAVIIAVYVIKHHTHHSKGHMLAEESFQVEDGNQANTLVSVAPLHPQEPLDKPTINGDSPENGTGQSPTNGHPTTQTAVADTEM